MRFSAERNSMGNDCVLIAQIGCSFNQNRIMSEMLDYYSVIRVLLRHGCELKEILNFLRSNAAFFYASSFVNSKKELDPEKELILEGELDFEEESNAEEELTLEGELDFEEEANAEEELDFEEKTDAETEVKVGAKLDSEKKHDIINHATQRLKFILKRPPNTLLHWLSFLSDQGLEVNNIDYNGFTPLMNHVFAIRTNDSDLPSDPGATLVVLTLCLLKADVTIREPRRGFQALHLLFYSSRDVVGSSKFWNLAYVLIRYGGADVHATTYDGASPLYYALEYGWEEEWLMVLHRCRISLVEYFREERQYLNKCLYLGDGDSTAIDTNDLPRNGSETAMKRKPFIGDRIGE